MGFAVVNQKLIILFPFTGLYGEITYFSLFFQAGISGVTNIPRMAQLPPSTQSKIASSEDRRSRALKADKERRKEHRANQKMTLRSASQGNLTLTDGEDSEPV